MKAYCRALWLVPLTATLLAATPAADPEDYVRKGNDAFEREDYDAALKFYAQAEERITNPGLVAFNKGAALYHTEDFRGAEMHYRRCLAEATGGRRAALLYDLGNCLLKQSRGADAKLLRQAIDCYRLCLHEPEAAASLAADARYNLELAKVLWVKAKQARPNKDQGQEPEDKKDPNKPDPKPPDDKTPGGMDPNTGKNEGGKPEYLPVDPRDPRQPIPVDNQQVPGAGNLPQVPDKDERTQMLPEDAARYVQKINEQIMREKREHQLRMAPGRRRDIPDY